MAALELCDVRLRLGGQPVLDGVTFAVPPGEVVALLGCNGAGKSTLLHAVARLRHHTGGTITVDGAPAGSAHARTALSLALQDVDFPVTVRVGELLRHVARHYPRPADPWALAQRLGIAALWRRQAGGLSGGQTRLVALACALVGRTRVMALDEPTAGLDREASERLWAVLRGLADDGSAVVFSSHRLEDVEQHADRVVLLDAGRVVADDRPDRLVAELGLTRVELTGDLPVESLPAPLPVRRAGRRSAVVTREPDDVVRWLVRSGTPFRDLTVERLGLDQAVDELLGRTPR